MVTRHMQIMMMREHSMNRNCLSNPQINKNSGIVIGNIRKDRDRPQILSN